MTHRYLSEEKKNEKRLAQPTGLHRVLFFLFVLLLFIRIQRYLYMQLGKKKTAKKKKENE